MRNNIIKILTITVCVILVVCFSLLGCKKKNPATPSGSEQASVESGQSESGETSNSESNGKQESGETSNSESNSEQESGGTSESDSSGDQESGETSESDSGGEQESVKQPIDSGDLELPIIKN